MNKSALLKNLEMHGCIAETDKSLSLTSKVIRGMIDGQPVVAVGGDEGAKTQISAFLDAVYWHHLQRSTKSARFILGSGARMVEVLPAIATLHRALIGKASIDVEVDCVPQVLTLPQFTRPRNWLALLNARDQVKLPDLAAKLSAVAAVDSFRWYLPVTQGAPWSGRIEGLQVCAVSRTGNSPFVLKVGEPGKKGDEGLARARFRELVGTNELVVDESSIDDAAAMLRRLAADRATGKLAGCEREHSLESMVLRGALAVSVEGERLTPVSAGWPFQFPTLWSDSVDATARYVDALMFNGEVPWVVELKVDSGGTGQYYRHAIGQAVLYREFIRQATWLHPWLKRHSLDPTKCQAAIAFPTHAGDQRALLHLAAQFDVTVARLGS